MARLVAHPTMAFGPLGHSTRRPMLGLRAGTTRYYPARSTGGQPLSVRTLRRETSQFRFPTVGGASVSRSRRASLLLGVPRARQP